MMSKTESKVIDGWETGQGSGEKHSIWKQANLGQVPGLALISSDTLSK